MHARAAEPDSKRAWVGGGGECDTALPCFRHPAPLSSNASLKLLSVGQMDAQDEVYTGHVAVIKKGRKGKGGRVTTTPATDSGTDIGPSSERG
jgi:hypothetical protein